MNVFPRANNNIAVDVRGKIMELKEMVDGVTDSVRVLADEVTRVTKVGMEGRLGVVSRSQTKYSVVFFERGRTTTPYMEGI